MKKLAKPSNGKRRRNKDPWECAAVGPETGRDPNAVLIANPDVSYLERSLRRDKKNGIPAPFFAAGRITRNGIPDMYV